MWRGGRRHAGYEPTRSPGRPTLEPVDGAMRKENGGGGNRTPDLLNASPCRTKAHEDSDTGRCTPGCTGFPECVTENAPTGCQQAMPDDPALRAITAAWPSLPEDIRAEIVTLVRAEMYGAP